MPILNHYSRKDLSKKLVAFNLFDVFAFLLIFSLLFAVIYGISHLTRPYHVGEALPISTHFSMLPHYAWRSTLRMLIAWQFSLLFTFIVGAWAAKSPMAERMIIPMIDVLQSVPILTFLPVGVWFFLRLFPGSMLGPECASIFVIFTSQVWNMTLSFYQSVRSVPSHFNEAACVFQLNAWQKFWRIDVPYALPGLVWNSMLSLSAGWFFVVASEAITIADQSIMLPGIGSYIAVAISQGNLHAIGYAIVAMFVVIVLYDQLLLRPLVYWSIRFKTTQRDEDRHVSSWFAHILLKARLLHAFFHQIGFCYRQLMRGFIAVLRILSWKKKRGHPRRHFFLRRKSMFSGLKGLLGGCFLLLVLWGSYHYIWLWMRQSIGLDEVIQVFFYGSITALRVLVLVFLCVLIWTPIGVWIGLRPKLAIRIQPLIQFLSALPVNLFYPLLFMLIIRYHLNVNLWASPLMVLGMQWYILFNVIVGTLALDADLQETVHLLQLKAWQKWRYFIIPGILPALLTGMITAAGGAWNASIVAELVVWHGTRISAYGLGAYIENMEHGGHFASLALGTMVMSFYVLMINRFLWQPLYRYVQKRCCI